MNEKPQSIWQKSWTGWRASLLMGWLVCMAAIAIFFGVYLLANRIPLEKAADEMKIFGIAAASMTGVFLLGGIVRLLGGYLNLKIALRFGAGIVVVVTLFYAAEDWRGWHAWNNFKREWEAKGERFDLASVVPPAVPDDQNFALTPVVETSYAYLLDKSGHEIIPRNTNVVNRLEMRLGLSDNIYYDMGRTNKPWNQAGLTDLRAWQSYFRNLSSKTNMFPIATVPHSPAADVLLALSVHDATIEEVRRASQLRYSRFPLEYDKENPANIFLPHLAALKGAVKTIQLRALAELQNGESQKALDDLRLLLRLADSIRAEPFLISHLVRISILQITLQPIYEGLAENRWSNAQLTELDSLLAEEIFLADYRTAMRGEMLLLQIGCIQWLRRHPDQIINLGGDYTSSDRQNKVPLPVLSLAWLIPSGWFYQNQYRCVRMTTGFFLPVVDFEKGIVSPQLVRDGERALEAETRGTTPYNVLEKMLVPALANAVKKFAYAQSSVNLARTAIALERFRLAHGNYPESLDLLVPQFITNVPHDVIGGGSLNYRREADGTFKLYSIGWNERDDGGVVIFEKGSTPSVDIKRGDWVWRYPKIR